MKWKKAVSSTSCGERVNWLYCNYAIGHDDHEVDKLTDNSSSFVTGFELFMVNKTPVFIGKGNESCSTSSNLIQRTRLYLTIGTF